MNDIVLSVVIPVFNEEKAIARVIEDHVKEIRTLEPELKDWEIVCVDDASTDGSLKVMADLAQIHPKIRVLRHEKNQGITASFHHLFNESRGTHIYVTAGDDQWPAGNLTRLFRKMKDASADLVIGVRRNRRDVYTPWRLFLSYVLNAIPKLIYKIDTKDANGIKFGRREIFVMAVVSTSFFAEVERIILAHRRGFKITTAPIEFKTRSTGKAKGAAWRNIWATLRDMIRFMVTR
jgi:glycosyltransferase involved in cell wall biosynthesis